MGAIRIGTAGWTVPRAVAAEFPAEGTTLERYADRFPVAEINSSFHRPHRHSTWQRWHDTTPADFRFAVKVPKVITHQRKLVDVAEPLAEFLDQAGTLQRKLAILLVQLPPKLTFEEPVADAFFTLLRSANQAAIVCEPRHPSWFDASADRLLQRRRVARVAADPAVCAGAERPGGWRGLAYWRLHGSPAMYRSSYADRISHYAEQLKREPADETWCIFDNTASGAAAGDALALMEAVR